MTGKTYWVQLDDDNPPICFSEVESINIDDSGSIIVIYGIGGDVRGAIPTMNVMYITD